MRRLVPLINRVDVTGAIYPGVREFHLHSQADVLPMIQNAWIAGQGSRALNSNPVGIHHVDEQHAHLIVLDNVTHGQPHAVTVEAGE